MKSANFASRKPKARVIASFDDQDDGDAFTSPGASTTAPSNAGDSSSAPVFKRKSSSAKTARKGVNRSLISLDDPHEGEDDASSESSEASRPVVVKKSTLSRQAIERNASQKDAKPRTVLKAPLSALPSQPFSQLSLSSGPKYSKEALAELRGSTPSTPISLETSDQDVDMVDAQSDPLDVAGKFAAERSVLKGSSKLPDYVVADAGRIKEIKARRAMMAQNPDYISLTEGSVKGGGSRLQRTEDDEEILETFVEDGGLALGKRAEREKERRRREDIREAIDLVERPEDEDESEDSDADDGNVGWEADRIRAGGYGSSKKETLEERLRKPPAVITSLPNFADAVSALQSLLSEMESDMQRKSKAVEDLIEEKDAIEQREKELQELLKQTSEKYEKLRLEAGTAMHVGRGLESFGEDHTGNGVPAAV